MSTELSPRGVASKALLLTSAMSLNLIVIYYSSDLTARMTAEPEKLGIGSFRDVEREGYKVCVPITTPKIEKIETTCPFMNILCVQGAAEGRQGQDSPILDEDGAERDGHEARLRERQLHLDEGQGDEKDRPRGSQGRHHSSWRVIQYNTY